MKLNAPRSLIALSAVLLLTLTGCQRAENPQPTDEPLPQKQAQPQASAPASKKDPIKIAYAGVMTGPDGSMGVKLFHGADVAVEEWNARGGVLGRPIEVIRRDDEGKPDKAVLVAQDLVNRDIAGVLGPINSGCTLPASAIYNASRIMELVVSTNVEITQRGFDNLFRCNGRDDQQGSVAADFITNKLKIKKLAILHNKTAFGEGIAKRVKECFEAVGGQIVAFDGVSEGELDFRSNIATLKAAGAEAVYWGGIYGQAGPFYNQLRQAGLEIPFISCDGSFDQSMINIIGGQPKDFYATFVRDWSKQPGAQKFEQQFKAKQFGDPGAFAFYGYDSANVLLKAIEVAGTTETDAVIRAMRSTTFDAILGKLTFDEKGDIRDVPYVIWTIADGKFKPLE